MKRIVLLLLLLSSVGWAQGARSILTGWCAFSNPNNSTAQTAGFLIGLGRLSASPQCLSDQPPFAPELGASLPTGGSLKNLRVAVSYRDFGDASSVPVMATVWLNFSPTALACTANLSGGSGTAVIVKCSDTTHVISVAAGDLVAVEIGVPDTITYCSGGPCPGISVDVGLERQQ
jgi:hypothetical protein